MKKTAIIMIFIMIINISLIGCSTQKKEISRTEYMLGTVITVNLFNQGNDEILDQIFNRLRVIENRMSANIEDSDISKVNKNAGNKPVKVHDDVFYVLKKAKEYAKLTQGTFNPTIGALVNLWGIGSEDEKVPTKEEISQSLKKINYQKMKLMEGNRVYLKEEGMKIDLGGIAKGYAADEVNRILSKNDIDRAIIDLGGNIYAKGEKQEGTKWRIGIQNPFETRNNYVGIIKVSNKSIVTSGNYERYFEKNGKRYHHILDSETGYPAKSEVAGVSIIAENSIDADALSTSFFILGVDKGLELAEKFNGVEAIFITKDHKIYQSSGIKNFKLTSNQFKAMNN